MASDLDGDVLNYTIGGIDSEDFTIDPSTEAVSINSSPDYESQSSYEFTVTASDGELSDSVAVTLSVNDLNEQSQISTDNRNVNSCNRRFH